MKLRWASLLVVASLTLGPTAFGAAFLPGVSNYPFGVNVNGGEAAPWNGQVLPGAATFDDLQAKGVKFIRLPTAWESWQTTPSGALNTTWAAQVATVIDIAYAHSIGVILDVHNEAHYCSAAHWASNLGNCATAGNAGDIGTGVSALGNGITTADFADLWTKIITYEGSHPGLIGEDIMNEPGGVIGKQTLFAPNGFADIVGAQPWYLQNSATLIYRSDITNPLGSSYGHVWQIDSGSGFGDVAQDLTLSAQPYTATIYGATISGTEDIYYGIAGASSICHLTTTWQRCPDFTFTPVAGTKTFNVGVNTASAGHNALIADAQLEAGSVSTSYLGANFYPYAQAAITAIRAIDQRPIYVSGPIWSACQWVWGSSDILTLTGGNLVFEAHQYPDGTLDQCGGGGTFTHNFSFYGITTQAGVTEITPFVDWCGTTVSRCFLGELGVVNSVADNDPSWLTLQSLQWQYLLPNRVSAAAWYYRSVTTPADLNIAPTSGVEDPRLATMMTVGQ